METDAFGYGRRKPKSEPPPPAAAHPELGKVLDGKADRDAIHIAIAPVVAVEVLKPGEHIGFVEPGNSVKVGRASTRDNTTAIGIVDPFLSKPVQPGQAFYMCVYPRTTQNLRHDWSHPAFTAQEVARKLGANESERWLSNFADSMDVGYAELLDNAVHAIKHQQWDDLCANVDTDMPEEFWQHIENVIGSPVPESVKTKVTYIPCAC
jgi:hypothetical protein